MTDACDVADVAVRTSFECNPSEAARDTISSYHFIIMLGMLFVSFLMVHFILQVKKRLLQKRIDSLPRRELPLKRGDASKKLRRAIVAEFARPGSEEVQVQPTAPDDETGWAPAGSKMANTHFKTSIACSHGLLEAAASEYHPDYMKKANESVREFVERLKQAPVQPDAVPTEGDIMLTFTQLCDYYIDVYERAKFGKHEFVYDEYRLFMLRCFRLICCLNPDVAAAAPAEDEPTTAARR